VLLSSEPWTDQGHTFERRFPPSAPRPASTGVLLPVVPAAVLLVALVSWLATDRVLRPVERMRAQAAQISATDLDRRLPVPDSRDRLARLAATFNATLDRVAGSARSQQRFVADAAGR
jgi:HAMP domain-containing protein